WACSRPRCTPAGFSRPAISITLALLPWPGRPLRWCTGPLAPGRPCAACWRTRAGPVPSMVATSPHCWARAVPLPARHPPRVRPLTRADLPLLARLHEQTPRAERDESGTDGLPAFGYLEDDALLSVACLGMWRGVATIGVVTHPHARLRGWAPAVVSAAARAGLTRRPVVQYRARRANTASIAVAERAGFTHYCDGLIIDLIP